MVKKCFVIDTNVLMYDPKALFAFDDNEVVIPLIVLDELDKHKSGSSQASMHARMVIRTLDEMRALGALHEGVMTESGGIIRVELNNINNIPVDLDKSKADNRIISVALSLQEKETDRVVAVITKDINLRVKCDALGVRAEDFTSDSVVQDLDALFMGSSSAYVNGADIDQLYSDGSVAAKEDLELRPNEYVHLTSATNTQHSALARWDGTELKKVKVHKGIWGISPRNLEQTFAFDALFDQDIKLVTMAGKAGTGKSLIAVAAGVSQLLDSGVYDKIVMTRPIVGLGKDVGFLPGPLSDKMSVWIHGLRGALDVVFSERGKFMLDTLMEEGRIDVQAITHIRGSSLHKSFIIIDEAQLLTKHEIKTIITRVGEGSKIILLGDVEQIDTPYLNYKDNGLSCAVEAFKTEGLAAHITLLKGERSELATLASEIL